MSYMDPLPGSDLGNVVGDGQCVAYVKKAAGCPITANWKPGRVVKGNNIERGTAIARFGPDGKYINESGKGHAAIYDTQDSVNGLKVWDQWTGQAVHSHYLRFGVSPPDPPAKDGNNFCVIEPVNAVVRIWNTVLGWIKPWTTRE